MSIWRVDFWKATGERAVKTFCQAAGSLLLADDVAGLIEVQWVDVASVAGLAALLSVLFSIGGNIATQDGPSFTHAEVVPPTDPATRAAHDLPPASPETRFGS